MESSEIDFLNVVEKRYYTENPSERGGKLFARIHNMLLDCNFVDVLISFKVDRDINITTNGIVFKSTKDKFSQIVINGKQRNVVIEVSNICDCSTQKVIENINRISSYRSFVPHLPFYCTSGKMFLYSGGENKSSDFEPRFSKEVIFWNISYEGKYDKHSEADQRQIDICLFGLFKLTGKDYSNNSFPFYWRVEEDSLSVYIIEKKTYYSFTRGFIPIFDSLHNVQPNQKEIVTHFVTKISCIDDISRDHLFFKGAGDVIDILTHFPPLEKTAVEEDSTTAAVESSTTVEETNFDLSIFHHEFLAIEELCESNDEIKMYLLKKLIHYLDTNTELTKIVNLMNNELLQVLPYISLPEDIDFNVLYDERKRMRNYITSRRMNRTEMKEPVSVSEPFTTPSVVYFWDYDNKVSYQLSQNGKLSSIFLKEKIDGCSLNTKLCVKSYESIDTIVRSVREIFAQIE